MEVNNGFGQLLKQARKYRSNMTQQQLADKIKKSASSVRKYESGDSHPPVDVIHDIASNLDLTLHLFNGEYYFRDHTSSNNLTESDIKKRDLFNQAQEQTAMQASGLDPRSSGEVWIADDGITTSSRRESIDRINANVVQLNDDGVDELANYSDYLINSEKYN